MPRASRPRRTRRIRRAGEHDQITVAWLGHATVLLNFFGIGILTDPALRARIGVRVGPLHVWAKTLRGAGLSGRGSCRGWISSS